MCTRTHACAHYGVLGLGTMSDNETWVELYIAERLREYEARLLARQAKEQLRRLRRELERAERHQRDKERADLRDLRKRLCGAKTRAGYPCRRKGLGRAGRCPNHGGLSTGPRTEAGRARVAEAVRRRWATRLTEATPGDG